MESLNPYRAPNIEELVNEDLGLEGTPEIQRVRRGLLFVHHGINGILLAMVAGPLLAILGSVLDFWVFPAVAGFLMLFGFGVGYISYTIGQWICTAVPVQSNAKRLATLAAVSQSISCLGVLGWFSGIFGFWAFGVSNRTMGPIIMGYSSSVITFAFMASLGLFVVFLKRLCLILGAEDLARSANITAIVTGIFLTCFVSLYAFASLGIWVVFGEILGAIIALTLVSLGLVSFVRFTFLVRQISKSIGRLGRVI